MIMTYEYTHVPVRHCENTVPNQRDFYLCFLILTTALVMKVNTEQINEMF